MRIVTTMIVGGQGFIGRRLSARLMALGEPVVCADISVPTSPNRVEGVRYVACDVSRYDSDLERMLETRPSRAVNLAYNMNSATKPHSSIELNIRGMDNFFEASRLADVEHVVFSSSLAVNGKQAEFGERAVTEADAFYGARGNMYSAHKVFNEHQAQEYREKHGMKVTSIRPANVTGHDKIFGSSDHVQVIVSPARGESVTLPFADTMRSIVYVDDVAEIFARVILSNPKHDSYNTGGASVSLQDLRNLVADRIPELDVRFTQQTGGREGSINYLIDNSRLAAEFGFTPRSARASVDAILDHVGREMRR